MYEKIQKILQTPWIKEDKILAELVKYLCLFKRQKSQVIKLFLPTDIKKITKIVGGSTIRKEIEGELCEREQRATLPSIPSGNSM